MEDFEKGAKRKCTQCSTLFFDFGKFPITCPNCGYVLTSLLTNVSKRGRPPKTIKPENNDNKEDETKVDEIEVNQELSDDISEDTDNDDSVEDIIEIDREES